MYHLTCTSICCSQPFQPNKSSSGWQPYLKCRRAFDIIYISIHASLFCHATIQSSARNLAHASLETAVIPLHLCTCPVSSATAKTSTENSQNILYSTSQYILFFRLVYYLNQYYVICSLKQAKFNPAVPAAIFG